MIRPIDVLTPFTKSEKNRYETFLVQMEGYMYNRTAAFAITMLENYERWIPIYPHLEMFCDMSALQIYNATMRYDVIDLLTSIIDQKLLDDEEQVIRLLMESIEELDSCNRFNHTVMPIIAYALKQLSGERCCEKIIICKSGEFKPLEIDYLRLLFGENLDKIKIVSGDYYQIWLDNKEKITTNFINDINILDKIAEFSKENNFPDYINNQLFLLRLTDKIVEIDKELNQARYNCVEHINELEKAKIHVGTIGTDPFPADGVDTIVRPSKN